MTKKRVIIASGVASPFRVSVAGVDASNAEFNDLIFDGNQQPMRLYATGYETVPTIANGDTANIAHAVLASGPSTPAGTNPLFMVMWRHNASGGDTLLLKTPQLSPSVPFSVTAGSGGGGAYEDGAFRALSCGRDPSGGAFYTQDNIINYAIFKNYQ